MNFFISVAISAGIGTAFVEVIFKLFLEHWLKEKYYLFTINKADRRECADNLLEILNTGNNYKWDNIGSDIYIKAFHLMDRLESLGEKEFAKKVGKYTSDQLMLRYKMADQDTSHQKKELLNDIVETEIRIGSERQALVEVAHKLKK